MTDKEPTTSTETSSTTATPPAAAEPQAAPNQPAALLLTEDDEKLLAKYLAEGWKFERKRPTSVIGKLSDEQIADMGLEAARLDIELRERRQGKNARQAALQREKKEREGAVSSVAQRIRQGKDELGRPLATTDAADYARRQAALSAEYDDFEAKRKEELGELKAELDRYEEHRAALARKVQSGQGAITIHVADLVDASTAMVVTVRLDNGEQHSMRSMTQHERQLSLFASRAALESMSAHEYTLAISGRVQDAARSYASRTGMEEPAAVKAIRALLPDDELPEWLPEDDAVGGDGDDVDDQGTDEQPAAGEDGGDLPPEAGEAAPETPPTEPEEPEELLDIAIVELPKEKTPVVKALCEELGIKIPEAKKLLGGKNGPWPITRKTASAARESS